MQSHFGWKSPQMAMEYVTKSKTAIKDVAALLSKGEEDGDHKEDVREGNGQVLVGVIWYGLLIIILFRRRWLLTLLQTIQTFQIWLATDPVLAVEMPEFSTFMAALSMEISTNNFITYLVFL